MKTRLSALLDGELEDGEAHVLFTSPQRDEYLRECRVYPLIGDVLRGESRLHVDLTGAVMAQLSEEPTVLAPRLRRSRWQRPAYGVAAAVAGAGVVAWLALSQQKPQDIAPQAGVGEVAMQPTTAADMREYVIAHQAQSPGLQLQGGTEHIRTVSLGYGK